MVQTTQEITLKYQAMDGHRKNIKTKKSESKKEKSLTNIIDRLKSNKDMIGVPVVRKKSKIHMTSVVQNQRTKSPNTDGGLDSDMPTDALSATSSAPPVAGHASHSATRTGDRRPSPDPESSSSPSLSPHSPSPARAFPSLLVPTGFGLRPSPFSPPSLERYSPANPAIKQMEMMTRNYSDFMRSLAAKYNQNNNNNNDGFSPLPQTNGISRGFDASFPYKGGPPFLLRNADTDGSGVLNNSGNRKLDNQNSPNSFESRNSTPSTNNSNNNSAFTTTGVSGISDFSSSQTLLNLVRTASAQSASQLENYLKGAVKRGADGENRLDPLDLTISNVKKPKLEVIRDFFSSEADISGGDCTGNARTVFGSKQWMSTMDKRMHSSPPSSSRTSPKIALERPRCVSLCVEKSCTSTSEATELSHWTVEDVVKFVSTVETCGEYAEKFREESIDGSTLPLLTEDHLKIHLGLKLGPALKLRSTLARKIGHCSVCMHCVHCHTSENTDLRRNDISRSPTISK